LTESQFSKIKKFFAFLYPGPVITQERPDKQPCDNPGFRTQGETPSNVLIYGKTGTGKTAVTRYVGKELKE
jgi:Cdc6-like AAA superfamily ATPase